MHGNNDGYATGSKDGTVILWDNDFKPITKLDMIHTPVGYEGDLRMISFPVFPFLWSRSVIKLLVGEQSRFSSGLPACFSQTVLQTEKSFVSSSVFNYLRTPFI